MNVLSVLVIDDNAAARKLLRSVLAAIEQRFVIYEAANGSEAMHRLKDNYYDIVFLDLELPDTNGFDILTSIKLEYPEQFVAIISANATVDNVKRTITLGGRGFIAKPYSAQKVKAIVDKYLAGIAHS